MFYREKSGASYKEVHNYCKPELCNHRQVFATVAYFLYRRPSGLQALHSFVRRPEKEALVKRFMQHAINNKL